MLTKQYYECHVTMLGMPNNIKPHVEKLKWKFSAIDGDPTLGDGVKCYATRHYNVKHSEKYVLKELFKIANELSKQNIKVLRRKIERVVFDDRIDTVKCTGACVECHMDDYKEIGKVI